jgi:ribosomal protein S18 acetylase RimI-like enzyme
VLRAGAGRIRAEGTWPRSFAPIPGTQALAHAGADYEPAGARRARAGEAPISVRPATAADLERLAGLAAEREGGPAEAHRERFAREIERIAAGEERLLLVAERAASVIGFARARLHVPGPDAPPNAAPPGWYLLGVVVAPAERRRGVGDVLTRRRLEWIAARATEAYYFVNARNRASIDLHARFGFVAVTRAFSFPGVTFEGDTGILFRAALRRAPDPPAGGVDSPRG